MEDEIIRDIFGRYTNIERFSEKYLQKNPDPTHADLVLFIERLIKETNSKEEDIIKQVSSSEFVASAKKEGIYLNIRYNYKKLSQMALSSISDGYGRSDFGKNRRIMVEHTSVNPNKALHIGHVRNACLGDSLSRIMKFSGYEVVVADYLDDTGAQVADNIIGIMLLGMPEEKAGVKIDHYLGDEVYGKVNKLYESDRELLEKRLDILKKIEEGGNEFSAKAAEMVVKVLKAQLQTLGSLDISFDVINRESDIIRQGFWEEAFDVLKEKKMVKLQTEGKNEGCWVFPSKTEEKVLVRSNNTVVYAGKDIAYAMWKFGLLKNDFNYSQLETPDGRKLWITDSNSPNSSHPKFNGVEKAISVIDIRQSYEQSVVKEAIEALASIYGKDIEYVHYQYEVVSLSPKTMERISPQNYDDSKKTFHMSGRKGIYVNADDLLSKLEERISQESRTRNPSISDEELEKISRVMAAAIIRFEMIKTPASKILTFDMDDTLKLEKGRAPYLLYTYARCRNIMGKAGSQKPSAEPKEEINEYEAALLRDIIRFPLIVKHSAADMNPTYIANFLSDLALDTNSFYEHVRVIDKEGSVDAYRLGLVEAVSVIMKTGLGLLGIGTLERI